MGNLEPKTEIEKLINLKPKVPKFNPSYFNKKRRIIKRSGVVK